MPESFNGYRIKFPTARTQPFVYSSQGARASGAIKDAKLNLITMSGHNTSGNDRVFQLFEEPPRAGLVPSWVVAVPAKGQFSWTPAQGGRVFDRLYFGVSSTIEKYTATTDTFWIDLEAVLL